MAEINPQNGQLRLSRLIRKTQVACNEDDFLIDEPSQSQEKEVSRETWAEGNIKSSRARLSQRVSRSAREAQSQSEKSAPKENQMSILRFVKPLPPKEKDIETGEADSSTGGECAHPTEPNDGATSPIYGSQSSRVLKRTDRLDGLSSNADNTTSKARKPELLYIDDDDDSDLETNCLNSRGALGIAAPYPPLSDQFEGRNTGFPATWTKYQIAGVVTLLSSDSSDHENSEAEPAIPSDRAEKSKAGSSLLEKHSTGDSPNTNEVLSLDDSQQSRTNPYDSTGEKEFSERDVYLDLFEKGVFSGELESFDGSDNEDIEQNGGEDDFDDDGDVGDVGDIREYDDEQDIDEEDVVDTQQHTNKNPSHRDERNLTTDGTLEDTKDDEDDDVDVYQFFTPISRLQSASSFDRQFRKDSTPTKRARTEEKFVENLMARVKERRENKDTTTAAKQQRGKAYPFRGRFRGRARGRARGSSRSVARGDPASSLVYDPASVSGPARRRPFTKRYQKPVAKHTGTSSASRSVSGVKGSSSGGRQGGVKLES